MSVQSSESKSAAPFWKQFGLACAILCGVMLIIFHQSLEPGMTLFSNDGPLGAISAESGSLPGGFFGVWHDLNWLGKRGIGASPNWSSVLAALTGPVLFSKIYAPFALIVLGLCTWVFFRQMRFAPMVCVVGAVASALNMDTFSTATWGLPAWSLSRAMLFLALAALVTQHTNRAWLKAALAGFAVGMGVMEGFDMGAIYSLFIAAFVLFQGVALEPGTLTSGLQRAGLRLVLVVVFACFIAAQSLTALIGTQVVGVVGTEQDLETKQMQWDKATTWSLPKREALRVIIPGLFGYRIDIADPSNYWGTVGQQPGWEQHRQGLPRHSGSGEYAGVLVAILAVWTLLQSFRGNRSPFDLRERRLIWFLAAAGLTCLLLAFGRHAPFYQLFYALPYFSTIRNPIKFMHPFQVSLLILFAYGLQDLSRRYLSQAPAKFDSLRNHLKTWWSRAPAMEKKWTLGSAGVLAASVLAWLLYASSRRELESYLVRVDFDAAHAAQIAGYSVREVGWFIFFAAFALGLLVLILSKWLSGPRAKVAGILLGLFVFVDLYRGNAPWILYYNYVEKYDSNPVIEMLREKPYERRVTILPLPGLQQLAVLQQFYHALWLQHHFQFYNIQSLDVVQEPRISQEKESFLRAMGAHPVRYWQLTNTRLLFGLVGLAEQLNQQMAPGQNPFRLHTAFELRQETAGGPILVQTNTTGPFALIELEGVLPRAKLYSQWEVLTNTSTSLDRLVSPEFDPHQTILINEGLPPNAPQSGPGGAPGSVAITQYAPKRVQLESQSDAPAVLLLNDKHDPAWRVSVDGQPQPVLRCNALMRGVYLPPGKHTIEFRFQPPLTAFYVSLAGAITAIGLCGLLLCGPSTMRLRRTAEPGQKAEAEPQIQRP